ncbi:Odorant receptor Or48 [Rhyzopertha dominica]|nr:Odorant receptor Or48 [Rhyzopertha dominica]
MPTVNIMRDSSKWIMLIPKMWLGCVGIWPEDEEGKLAKLVFWLQFTLSLFISVGQLAYLIVHRYDIMKVISTMITFSAIIQLMIKMVMIKQNAPKLKHLLFKLRNEFWPSSARGPKIEAYLRKRSSLVLLAMCFVYTTGFCYILTCIALPLIGSKMELPLNVVYNFNTTKSPVYEIVYVAQATNQVLTIMHGIPGHDDLFFVMCSNVVAQFVLLNDAVGGVLREGSARTKLRRYICHHLMLLRFCDGIEEVFSFSLLVQLLLSAIGICTSAVVLSTRHLSFTSMFTIFFYCLASVVQFFLFCLIGAEVAYHSSSLSLCTYNCGWEHIDDNNLKRSLIFIILRAQRARRLSIKHLAYLDLTTYLLIMRGIFSFFAVLSSLTRTAD